MEISHVPVTIKGFQHIGDLSSASSLTIPQGSNTALIQAVAGDVHWLPTGGTPTASVGGGMLLKENSDFVFKGDLTKFNAIAAVSGAKLNVIYYHEQS